ncbi:MAG: FAD-dependent protein [Spirochaetota bacterium]
MLMRHGVRFRPKGFALGSRVEHPQALINEAQWGTPVLAGVGAAEYRLTSDGDGSLPVYTFCMCPGGIIVPAAASEDLNVVNGMSLFARDGQYANAGCVAGIDARAFLGDNASASSTLDWLESIERSFSRVAGGFRAPACSISEFIARREPASVPASSYPLGLLPAPLWELLPPPVGTAIAAGLKNFSRRIRGFETGSIMGLESKSSAPIQVIRGTGHRCEGFGNLAVVGEGSGFAGGIISSAVDGITCAMELVG